MILPKILMLFLLSKCLATPKHLFQKPLWPYDYFRTKTQVSQISCRFSRKSIPQEKHDGMMGGWVAIDPMPGRRILYGGELGGPQIPKVITAGAQRPWPMGPWFRIVLSWWKWWNYGRGWTNTKDGSDGRCSKMDSWVESRKRCGNPGVTLFINAEFIG
jgi:hypothetical protein